MVDRLWEMRDSWCRRGNAFYTLGAATYLDVCGGDGSLERYEVIHDNSNLLLLSRFGDMLEEVRRAINQITGQCCRLTDRFALPGFHIFLAGSLHQRFRDNLHLDLQYTYLPFEADLFTPTLTFTLPLALPSGGAGIEFCRRSGKDPRGILRVEPYVPGEILLHSGRALHRRAYFPASDRCIRITLQGHGLLVDGCWILYW